MAVEPASSPLVTKGYAAAHAIQGIGANFVPSLLDKSVIDEFVTAENDAAYDRARELASVEGLLAGISSGANLDAAIRIAESVEGKNIVTVLPDSGSRYLSTDLYKA